MNARRRPLLALGASLLLAGCATTGEELTPRERARLEREAERRDRQQAQSQARTLRDSQQRRTTR